jgi:hypothetical protein
VQQATNLNTGIYEVTARVAFSDRKTLSDIEALPRPLLPAPFYRRAALGNLGVGEIDTLTRFNWRLTERFVGVERECLLHYFI